jgi:Nucleotidyl transferase AbiEii toxin, Type IV TA system
VSAPTLAERIVALDTALASFPHAFGGALALAYYAEPRATIDIDLNVFVTVDEFPVVAAQLVALGTAAEDPLVAEQVRNNGQARVMWDATPVDLFFAYDAFHEAAKAARRNVPFADREIPILAVEHLVVCKVVFNRAKDWVDIDAIVAAGTAVDLGEVLRWVGRILGDEDPRYDRIAAVLSQPGSG